MEDGDEWVIPVDYEYEDVGDTGTTTRVSQISFPAMSADYPTWAYEYDKLGNITQISENSAVAASYAYDDQSQLVTEVLPGKRVDYSYDTAGNILSVTETDTGTEGSEPVVHTYSYNSTNGWKDQLTGYDGHTITYDGVGNPLTYYNGTDWTFTWTEGRKLAAAISTDTSVSYEYDSDGYRTSKTVGETTYEYIYLGGKLTKQTWDENTIEFFYDHQDRPYGFIYNGVPYYYILNLQGDVMMIVDDTGYMVGRYQYDAWGNQLEVFSRRQNIADVNPLRYRGYVYDSETGLYYLNSRYYDPGVRRFISSDSYVSTGRGIVSYNMYCYGGNNPVNTIDPSGTAFMFITAVVGAVIGGIIGAVTTKSVSGAIAGAAIGGLVGLGLGAATSAILTGSAIASTAAVLGTASTKLAATGTVLGTSTSKLVDKISTAYQKVKSVATGTTDIFRSVSGGELSDIKSTGQFNLPKGGMESKQFAFSYSETAAFGKRVGQSSIVRASVPNQYLSTLDSTSVDPFLFRSGTITVWSEQLASFNKVVSGSIKIMP